MVVTEYEKKNKKNISIIKYIELRKSGEDTVFMFRLELEPADLKLKKKRNETHVSTMFGTY